MNDIKAVFFDFDDTLQDREKAYKFYCELFMGKYLPNIPPDEKQSKINDMLSNAQGGYLRREELFPLLINLWRWENHPDVGELVYHFNHTFGKHTELFDGAVDTIKYLKQKGYKLGIITNGNSVVQNDKLDSAGIRQYFDVIIVSGDFGKDKPAREIFDEAARWVGIPNENIAYVGDHPVNDIEGAMGAGMKPVWINFGYFKDKCRYSVPTVTDIRQIKEMF